MAPDYRLKKVRVNDISLCCIINGSKGIIDRDKQTLLFITGYGGLMEMWPPSFLEPIEKQYNTVLFDNRVWGSVQKTAWNFQ